MSRCVVNWKCACTRPFGKGLISSSSKNFSSPWLSALANGVRWPSKAARTNDNAMHNRSIAPILPQQPANRRRFRIK